MNETTIINILSLPAILLAITLFLAKSPVHSVFSLVGVFLFSSAILLMLGLEMLTWILILVYVGALAVLILFVVMMLNLKQLPHNLTRYLFVTGLLLIILPLSLQLTQWPIQEDSVIMADWTTHWHPLTQLQNMGFFLYQDLPELLIISAYYLMAALTGVILLTKKYSDSMMKRQSSDIQVLREWKG